ncbi:MAG: hypothetical protein EOO10_18115 [Chitinophagaceae bacterium]|nr:MAG: hypothetical protein EOO10_18115 [Chitinophagaceae bacterium]
MRQLQVLLCLFLFPNLAICQNKQPDIPVYCKEFFTNEEPLEITLVSDFKKLKSQKKKDVYQPAYASIKFSSIDSLADSVRIAARGEFRRTLCQMPSLMVNFKGNTSSPFAKLKKLKMVCGCNSSDYNERLVLTEYLVYKIYNLLTDMSFRVRLAKTIYQDQNNKGKPVSQYAFFIEDVDELAKRNGCKEYKNIANSLYSNRKQMTLMNIFQYMIGNTDWSVPNYHNIKLIYTVADSTAYPYIIHYDFDFSGLVNASYAFPNHELFTIEKVTDRFYRGMPRTLEEVEAVLETFKNTKEKIMQLISGFELLPSGDRQTMVSYLEEFYETINNKKKVEYHFVKGMKQ